MWLATTAWVLSTNNSLCLQESWHFPPSSLSLAGWTLESCPLDYSSLPSFLTLPLFLPILPLHSPSTRETTNRNGVLSSTVTATALPDANPSKLQHSQPALCLGTGLRVYRAEFAWSQLQQRERQWQRGYKRRPTAMETQEKNDRDRITLTTGNS